MTPPIPPAPPPGAYQRGSIGCALLPFAAVALLILLFFSVLTARAEGNAAAPDYDLAGQLLQRARLDWQQPGPVIRWDQDPASATAWAGFMGWALPYKDGSCGIGLAPAFWSASPAVQQTIVDHEFGHCLGLEHSLLLGDVMYPNPIVPGPTPAEVARARALHPWRFQCRISL